MMVPKYSAGGFLAKTLKKALEAGEITYKGLNVQANSFNKSVPELKDLLKKLINTSKEGKKLSHEDGKKLIDLLQQHKGNYKSLNKFIPKNWGGKSGTTPRHADINIPPAASATPAERAALNAEAEQAMAQAASTPVAEAAAAQAVTPGAVQAATTAAQGRLARAYGAMKNHPWLTAAAVAGLTNGSVRSGLGTAFNYWTTPASQWDSIGQVAPNSQMQIRLNDGSVVPVTMGQDGILTFGGQTTSSDTGADPSDAAIAQAIAEASGTSAPEVTTTETPGTYTTNSDYNDIFEDDAWDQ